MAVSSLPLWKTISKKQVSEDPDSAEVENKNSPADIADLRRGKEKKFHFPAYGSVFIAIQNDGKSVRTLILDCLLYTSRRG